MLYRFEQSNGTQKRRYLRDFQKPLEEQKTLLKTIYYLDEAIKRNLRIKHPSQHNLEEELLALSNSFKICNECKVNLSNVEPLHHSLDRAKRFADQEYNKIVDKEDAETKAAEEEAERQARRKENEIKDAKERKDHTLFCSEIRGFLN